MRLKTSILFTFLPALTLVGCNATVLEERYEYSVLASVEVIEIPPSSHSDSLRVRLAGVLGENTGYSFRQIFQQQADTLVELAVYGTFVEETGKTYEIRDIRYDTTFAVKLQQPRTSWYYFRIVASNGIFRDSSSIHQ